MRPLAIIFSVLLIVYALFAISGFFLRRKALKEGRIPMEKEGVSSGDAAGTDPDEPDADKKDL